ncbi:MAG: polyprenyl synthetase family protein [Pseudomonadales bacterium]|jgi:octaprenyl-diphosphate synthase|nr:polyprenyl synthetase family protein [Pseudomonadales bacterium]
MTANPADNALPRPVPDLPFYDVVLGDFAAVNDFIPRQLTSDVDLVEEIGSYIVQAGGKRLRPLLVLLGANCCGDTGDRRIKLAAIIEFLHTATLLHDDVVDHSGLRRGRVTANAVWGNAPSVLVGDFLYSRAFQLMVELGDLEVMRILADATNVIAEGEVLQLAGIGRLDLDEARYMNVIRCKTAMLFQAASHTAAVLARASQCRIEALRDYGNEIGLAFQLVDDALDYAGDTERLGKNVGDDLAEGKLTLPLIHTLRCGDAEAAGVVRDAVNARSAEAFAAVRDAVRASGSIEYTLDLAERCIDRAHRCLEVLPANPYRDALTDLANFALQRDF